MEDMTNSQFNKLLDYLRIEIRAVVKDELAKYNFEERFDRIDRRFDRILGVLEKDKLEIGAMSMQLDRHEERITRLEQTA